MKLLHGDCLELMKDIPDKSIDMILCDMPYGTTDNYWDKALDLDKLWSEYKRIIKSGGAIVLFSQLPFAVDLINANRKWFRYEWIWKKDNATGFLNANKMPLKKHENILVFYDKLPTYNPQFTSGKAYFRRRGDTQATTNYGKYPPLSKTYDGKRYPVDVIKFNVPKVLFGKRNEKNAMPTQKPVALLEYLINTYTNEGETVLDNCMGSGSTGVACMNTGRDFVGMELDEDFYNMAVDRINNLGGNTMRKLDISKRYRHFKGFEVTILALGTHTETNETMVVYSCDSFNGKSRKKDENSIYIRPLEMFMSEVDHAKYPDVKQKYRFEEI